MKLYIDPGTGSMLFTILIGLIGAGFYSARMLIIKLRFRLSGGKAELNRSKIPLAIFSDDKRYWNIFEPICRELDKRGFDVVYLTASEDDPALNNPYAHIKAEFIGGAMDYDVALLKVTGSQLIKDSQLTAATLGDSNTVKVGEKTFAVGNSNGLGVSVTSGIVSVDSETITMTSSDGQRAVGYRVMRTDASVNHGNSGGGLFDLDGNLIGITNAKNVEDETDNICYALPITQVKYLIKNIWDTLQSGSKTGYVSRAMLGIETTFSDSSLYLDAEGELAVKETFYVRNVTAGSAADGVFQTMDIIQAVTINGVKTEFPRRYLMQDIMLNIRKGDSVVFTVLRDKQLGEGKETVELTVTFDENDFVKYA